MIEKVIKPGHMMTMENFIQIQTIFQQQEMESFIIVFMQNQFMILQMGVRVRESHIPLMTGY